MLSTARGPVRHDAAMPTHVLFDFFGTLVEYSPSRTEQGYEQTHALLRRVGAEISYDEFLVAWSETSAGFDRRADADDREFSMTEASTEFLDVVLGRTPTGDEVNAFVGCYVGEWNKGVTYRPEVVVCLDELAADYRLAVVSNTHQPGLVPGHLAAMGVLDRFDAVVHIGRLRLAQAPPEDLRGRAGHPRDRSGGRRIRRRQLRARLRRARARRHPRLPDRPASADDGA